MRDITSQEIIRNVLLKNFPLNQWLDITEIYELFQNSYNDFKPDDFLPLAKYNKQEQWKRNIRVALRQFKLKNVILWNGNKKYLIPSIENEAVEILIQKKMQISEENLWKQLERKRIIGIDGENYVIEYEKNILINIGKVELAKKVKRVSDENVTNGYDVISYDSDGKEKFIEVKTTTTSKFNFEISSNELKKAEEFDSNYFLYFLRNFDSLKEKNELIIYTYSELIEKFDFIPNNFVAKMK